MGPEKRGKSWMLMDVAWRALRSRRKVAFFEVGDMSQAQILRRLATRAARQPIKSATLKIPKELIVSEEEGVRRVHVEFEEEEFTRSLSWRKAWQAFERSQKRLKTKESLFKLAVHPSDTISADGVLSQLQVWSQQGWDADVVVIDYADILAPPAGFHEDTRAQTNATWKRLRSISQSQHCLVVTATQTDAASYDAPLIRRTHFSEDKRKFAHVTGMIGLNQSISEKELGVLRLNWVLLRESEYSEGKCVYLAGCLGLGNPTILSKF